jgi:hypothetical protein
LWRVTYADAKSFGESDANSFANIFAKGDTEAPSDRSAPP